MGWALGYEYVRAYMNVTSGGLVARFVPLIFARIMFMSAKTIVIKYHLKVFGLKVELQKTFTIHG